MIVKIHKTADRKKIVAVCDSDLLGKKIEEGNISLDLSSDFYNGKERKEKETLKTFDDAYIVNLAGEKSVKLGEKAGIISKNNIIRIKGVPHAQAILF